MLLSAEVMLPRHEESAPPPPKWRLSLENFLVVFVVIFLVAAAVTVAVEPPFSISDTRRDIWESSECLLDKRDSKDHLQQMNKPKYKLVNY